MAKVPYEKRALRYAEQLTLLEQRGLIIENRKKCIHLLEHISYYRLSGYWYPFLEEPKFEHKFKKGSTFEKSYKLYLFDKELRKFIQSELEKIEVSVRAKMIYEFWHNDDAFWYSNAKHFKNTYQFEKSLQKLTEAVKNSDADFIKSFNENYSDPLPPACMILEVSSFGNLSNLFGNLRKGNPEARSIANYYGLNERTFSSWLHCFTYVRNLCAHHSRLWNRTLNISPEIPRNPKRAFLVNNKLTNPLDPNQPTASNNRVYFLISMITYLMDVINPKHRIKEKLEALTARFPDVDLRAMGFPEGWESEDFWKLR
jgi:abortive infection bacteriophage resistance protein